MELLSSLSAIAPLTVVLWNAAAYSLNSWPDFAHFIGLDRTVSDSSTFAILTDNPSLLLYATAAALFTICLSVVRTIKGNFFDYRE